MYLLISSYSNYSEFGSWTLEFSKVQTPEFRAALARLKNLRSENDEIDTFFLEHTPRLIFSSYGANLSKSLLIIGLGNDETSLSNRVNELFDLMLVDELSLSIAVNSFVRDKSVVLQKNNLLQAMTNVPGIKTFTKGFTSNFVNFECTNRFPTSLETVVAGNLTNFERTLQGLHGYSDISNVLRRNPQSEPYAGKPMANLLAIQRSRTDTNGGHFKAKLNQFLEKLEKQCKLYFKQGVKVENGIADALRQGSQYRLEMTATYKLNEAVGINTLFTDLNNLVTNFQGWARQWLLAYARTVDVDIFPKNIGIICGSISAELVKHAKLYINNPEGYSLAQKEYAIINKGP